MAKPTAKKITTVRRFVDVGASKRTAIATLNALPATATATASAHDALVRFIV